MAEDDHHVNKQRREHITDDTIINEAYEIYYSEDSEGALRGICGQSAARLIECRQRRGGSNACRRPTRQFGLCLAKFHCPKAHSAFEACAAGNNKKNKEHCNLQTRCSAQLARMNSCLSAIWKEKYGHNLA